VELLAEMFSQPARPPGTPHGEPLSDEGLREDYFREEKEGLARDIAAIGDDRMSYSHYRCLVEMCRGEPFAEHSLGRPGELEALTAPALNAFRTELLTSAPFSAYLTGPTDDRTIERVAEGLSSFIKTVSGDGRPAIPPSAPHPRPVKEREVFEEADVEQARLVIGLQTGVLHGDPQHPAQVIFSGLLGGFVHSRLFRRIREEAGLAYYAWARVAPTKGIILISCGIQEKNYGKALDLIRKELESLGRGDFTGDEFEATRNSVLAQAKAALDSPAAMVYGHLERRAAGDDPEEMAPWRSLARVTAGEVKEFGSRPVIDTIYLLGRRGL
jgi:predicted Zn-dependent peptidase